MNNDYFNTTLFLTVALVTGRWGFFFGSLMASFISRITALINFKNYDCRQNTLQRVPVQDVFLHRLTK
ncbi:hypothetical protein DN393_17590 [Bacillus sp. BPN334]|nr:hypothetical protein DN393_17590 [Bacillus sp. BPN334]